MTPEFNLLTEKWIPVITLDTGQREEVSLQDVFRRAHHFKEVYDSSPVITISLYRLLLAILYRSYRFSEMEFNEKWLSLWQSQCFDDKPIADYLNRFANHFYLFHHEFPFFQIAGCEVVEKKTVNKQEIHVPNPDSILRLITEAPDGGGPTLFDHRMYTEPQHVTLAETARLLVAAQGFGTSASQTGRVRFSESGVPINPSGRMMGICLNGATVWLEGDTLFETLMLNFSDYESPDDDMPPWECKDAVQQMQSSWRTPRVPKGRVQRFTWQGRALRLLLPEVHSENLVVSEVYYTQGDKYMQMIDDPMKVVITTDKDSYVRMNREKASWRDAHSLLSLQHRQSGRPAAAIRFVSDLIGYGDIPETLKHRRFTLHVAGLVNDPQAVAKVFLWRHDRMTVPAALLNNETLVGELQSLILEAEEWEDGKKELRRVGMARQLRERFQLMSEIYLSPNYRDRNGKVKPNGRKPDPKDIQRLTDALDPRRAYWARLETHFQTLLLGIADNPTGAAETWRDAVEAEAHCAFKEAVNSLGDTVRAQQAQARVFPYFRVASRRTQTS